MPLDSGIWTGADAAVGGDCNASRVTKRAATISVAVAHGDAIVRAGLNSLLGAYSDLRVDMEDASPPSHHGADVIIFDYAGGLDYMRCANARRGDTSPRVLIITHRGKEWQVHTALKAGVHGYVRQSADSEQLLAAVRALGKGTRYLSDELRGCIDDSRSRVNLTGRETDVLQQLAHGDCNKRIARSLGIGVGTVKTHVKGLCDKLGATTRTQVVVLAIRRGLVCDGALDLAIPELEHQPFTNIPL